MRLKKYFEYYNNDNDNNDNSDKVESLPEITGKQGSAVIDVSVSPNGEYIASVDGRLHLWSKSGNNIRKVYTPSILTSVSFIDNDTVVTGNVNGVIQIWNVMTGKIVRNFLRS